MRRTDRHVIPVKTGGIRDQGPPPLTFNDPCHLPVLLERPGVSLGIRSLREEYISSLVESRLV
jgi:hypothetical protein